MKHNRILFFFSVSAVLSLVLRIVQIYFSIDKGTGFFKKEYTPEAQYILVVIFLFALALFIFSLKSHRAPASPPQGSFLLALASVVAAGGILYELFTHSIKIIAPTWQILALSVSATLCAAWLVLFAAHQIFGATVPAALAVFPTVYMIFKMIFEFMTVSSLALVSDNMFSLFAMATVMLFMLNLTKLFTASAKDKGFRLLLGWGFVASLICLTQSTSHFLIRIFTGENFAHVAYPSLINMFTLGAFILTFILTHFSQKNADK